MPTDDSTSLSDLKNAVSQFVGERDWHQFHDPKNLVMAMSSEVGELADLFRWVDNRESLALAKSPDSRVQVAHELADVLMFVAEFASVCEIDLATAVAEKLEVNAGKYPIEKAKGSSKKYDQL